MNQFFIREDASTVVTSSILYKTYHAPNIFFTGNISIQIPYIIFLACFPTAKISKISYFLRTRLERSTFVHNIYQTSNDHHISTTIGPRNISNKTIYLFRKLHPSSVPGTSTTTKIISSYLQESSNYQ